MPWRELQLAEDRAALQPADMVYRVPVIIGAKKGLPSFNALEMQTRRFKTPDRLLESLESL